MGLTYELGVLIFIPLVVLIAFLLFRLLKKNKWLRYVVLGSYLIVIVIALWKLGELLLFLSLIG
jgi:uncharacterized BrkB/YihY/UPF0761 family membrane protein